MAHAHARPRRGRRRVLLLSLTLAGGAAVSSFLVVNAFAAGGNTSNAADQKIVCPTVALPAVPAAAQAGVNQEIANLTKQLDEANTRLVNTRGQGGPNFVQNAILGPLADKRKASLDRIIIDIGRVTAKPSSLDQFATCSLSQAGAQQPPIAQPAPPPATGGTGNGNSGNNGNAGNGGNTGNNGGTGAAQKIVCPTPVLPAVPAGAQAGVNQELANLTKQLNEANTRLINTRGQGGPNFVQNAILGPLADKRKATLDRIAIDIGRITTKPQGLDRFATCALR
jgi:hypothetical protein